MLTEQLLTGTVDKVAQAVGRLQLHEPAEGYYVAFSGGKDSQCILRLAELAKVAFDAHFNVTTLDPPELLRFIRDHYPTVGWNRPEQGYEARLLKKQFPPLRFQRWCCELLKEQGGQGRVVVTGVRRAESRFRSKRGVFERCFKGGDRRFLNPIIDWTTADVWEFLSQEGLPCCELYMSPPEGPGWTRIGCLMCPCATRDKRRRDAEAYPRVRARFVRMFQKLVDVRRERGKPFTNWQTGEDLFEWWIADKRRGKPDCPGQVMIFE